MLALSAESAILYLDKMKHKAFAKVVEISFKTFFSESVYDGAKYSASVNEHRRL